MSKIAFTPIHNGYLIILFSNLSGTVRNLQEIQEFCMSLRHVCKQVVPANRLYQACEDPAGGGLFIAFSHSSWNNETYLMEDCNPERIMFMKHLWLTLNYIPVLNVHLIVCTYSLVVRAPFLISRSFAEASPSLSTQYFLVCSQLS